MKYLYKPAMLVASLMVWLGGTSQVSFTNQGGMLQAMDGFSYEDCAADMNNDNLDDVIRVTGNGVYIDYQNGDGTMTGVFYPVAFTNQPSWSIAAGDLDGNGFTDLLFGDGNAVSFVMASDDGTSFAEYANPDYIFSQRTTLQDIDLDGDLDAFVCHDVDLSHPYRNDGTGTMTEDQSLVNTLPVGGNYAAIWCDYDYDGDSDLYLTKCRGGAPFGDERRTNLHYRNNGDGTFTEVGAITGLDDHNNSWATVFEDFDNDGDFDTFTVNHSTGDMPMPLGASNRFMQNNGDGTFTDITASTGISMYDLGAWNCDAGDFDNNGFMDIFSEMGSELFLNNGDGTFTAQDLNFDSGGIGDMNNDGFLDVINGNSLYINDGNDNNWVTFYLEGLISNKDAIGAKIEIYGDWGVQVREVRAGESFAPFSSLMSHFGLGTATEIDQVIVRWPSGMITTYDDVEINTANYYLEVECLLDPTEVTANNGLEICPGATLELSAVEGYDSYTWSNGADGQTTEISEAGNYSVILWDDECASISNTVTVTVLEDETPEIALEGEAIVCAGEQVILTASNGDNYEWSNDQTQQSILVTETGDYFVMIDALCSDDVMTSETISVVVLDGADVPEVTDMEIGTPGSVDLTATGDNIIWYANEFDTESIAEGATYSTPVVNDSYTVWAESNTLYPGVDQEGGMEVADYLLNGGLPSTGAYSYFDAFEFFTIQSVEANVPEDAGAGVRTIQLVDNSGVVLEETTFDLAVGTHTLDLNFDVPVGTQYSLRCVENNLFRSSGGVTYPYAIGSVGSITDSFYGETYYYYFYNWQVTTQEWLCPSDRVEVTVNVVSVNEIEELASLNVYPNPATDVLSVEMELTQSSAVVLTMTDIAGRTVHTEQANILGSSRISIPVEQLQAGVYTLAIQINGKQVVRKIIVE